MVGFFWLNLYTKVLTVIGWLNIIGAPIVAIALLADAANVGAFRRITIPAILGLMGQPLIMLLAGLSCLGLAELIYMIADLRSAVLSVSEDIRQARKRQAERINQSPK